MSFGELSRAIEADPDGGAADAFAITVNGREEPTKGCGYQFTDALATAVDVAITLGRPLLVAGEPGCGKTELGLAVARRLGIGRAYLFPVKTTSVGEELFYTYDALRRFRDTQLVTQIAQQTALTRLLQGPPPDSADGRAREAQPQGGQEQGVQETDVGDYVDFQALGRAILDAHEHAAVKHLLRGRNKALRPPDMAAQRSLVIIDEIDKAPSDFANDLLYEIENMRFRVKEFPADPPPETPPMDGVPVDKRPIVIVTSNEERQLPDAFLRRCVFHELVFPEDPALLARIVDAGLAARLARMGLSGEAAPRLDPAVTKRLAALVSNFRGLEPDKKPGTAEMIDAAALLVASESDDLSRVWPTLAKLKRDVELIRRVPQG